MSGSVMSSVMAPGLNSRASGQRRGAAQRHQRPDAAVVRHVQQDARERGIVFHDQQDRIARRGSDCDRRRSPGRRPVAVGGCTAEAAGYRARCPLSPDCPVSSFATPLSTRAPASRTSAPALRNVGLRQIQRERAARIRGALCKRISPPSSRASSRLIERPRPVPPYLRLVVPSACWNASKMMRCFSVRDADAGIGHRERDHRFRRGSAPGDSDSSPPPRAPCAAAPSRAR